MGLGFMGLGFRVYGFRVLGLGFKMLGGHRGLKAKLRVLRESSSGCWLRLKNAYKLQFVNKLPGVLGRP